MIGALQGKGGGREEEPIGGWFSVRDEARPRYATQLLNLPQKCGNTYVVQGAIHF